MLRRLITSLAISLFAVFVTVPALVPAPASAQTAKEEACRGAQLGDPNVSCDDTGFRFSFKSIVNVIIFIVGALAVLMIIIGAIRFVTSSGNDQAVQDARNTILYAVVGLVIAFLAFAIVNFVIERLT